MTVRTEYKPTEYDLSWTRDLIKRLTTGGVWCYKSLPIMVVKVSDNRVRIVVGDLPPAAFPGLESNLGRLKAVLSKIGVTVDQEAL